MIGDRLHRNSDRVLCRRPFLTHRVTRKLKRIGYLNREGTEYQPSCIDVKEHLIEPIDKKGVKIIPVSRQFPRSTRIHTGRVEDDGYEGQPAVSKKFFERASSGAKPDVGRML